MTKPVQVESIDFRRPVTTLPGFVLSVPEGTKCDQHPDRDAVRRVQGETDSFGCEYLDVCQECFDGIRAYKDIGTCDWCKTPEVELRPRRDVDEGMAGPVYRVCAPCRKRDSERLAEEVEEFNLLRDDYDPIETFDDDRMYEKP